MSYTQIGSSPNNLFNHLNTNSNMVERNAERQNQFAIPEFMSPRVFNLSVRGRFNQLLTSIWY